jgi:hypothetical protein
MMDSRPSNFTGMHMPPCLKHHKPLRDPSRMQTRSFDTRYRPVCIRPSQPHSRRTTISLKNLRLFIFMPAYMGITPTGFCANVN